MILSTFCRWLPSFPAMSKTEPATDRETIGLLDFVARLVTSHGDGFSSALSRLAISIPCPADKAPQHIEAVKHPLDLSQVGCAASQSLFGQKTPNSNAITVKKKRKETERGKKK